MADISLVIINDDAEEYCSALFKSIKEQINPADLDIVFIDNCSKDNSVQKAKEFGIRKVTAFDRRQKHRGVLYNKGFSLAERNNIIFAHSDILFNEKFFNKLILKIENQETGDFTSFSEFAPSVELWGRNAIGIDNTEKNIFVRELFMESSQDVEWLLDCSAACFMVNRKFLEKAVINEDYRNSFIEHSLLLDVLNNEGRPVVLDDCCYVHYSIELHEKIQTYEDDRQMFVINLIKYYRSTTDRLCEHVQRLSNHNVELSNHNAELTNHNGELTSLIEDYIILLKEMPVASFFFQIRGKLKMKLKRIMGKTSKSNGED